MQSDLNPVWNSGIEEYCCSRLEKRNLIGTVFGLKALL